MKILLRSPEAAGAAIRDLRKAASISQAQLAEKLGTRQPTISRLERGDGGVQMRLLFDALMLLKAQLTVTSRTSDTASIDELF